jgi:hypothetical protein
MEVSVPYGPLDERVEKGEVNWNLRLLHFVQEGVKVARGKRASLRERAH